MWNLCKVILIVKYTYLLIEILTHSTAHRSESSLAADVNGSESHSECVKRQCSDFV